MRRDRTVEISMGSMADIAFLLLIFFLVATTLDIDTGILRKLPPMVDDPPEVPSKERDILVVLVNRNDKLMVEGEETDISDLRHITREFIQNKDRASQLPEIFEMEVEHFGLVPVTKNHIISLRSDRGTSYDMYVTVQNELEAAYNELRGEMAIQKWDRLFSDLEKDKKEAILKIYPMRISEAEPK